MFKKKD